MKKFSEVPTLSVRPFQNVQHEVIYFPFAVRKNVSKLFKYFSMHCKSRAFFSPYNFLTPIKSSIPDVWNWNCWTLFGLQNEVWDGVGGVRAWEGMTSLQSFRWLRPCTYTCHIIKHSKLQKHVFYHYKAWESKLVSVLLLLKVLREEDFGPEL